MEKGTRARVGGAERAVARSTHLFGTEDIRPKMRKTWFKVFFFA